MIWNRAFLQGTTDKRKTITFHQNSGFRDRLQDDPIPCLGQPQATPAMQMMPGSEFFRERKTPVGVESENLAHEGMLSPRGATCKASDSRIPGCCQPGQTWRSEADLEPARSRWARPPL